MKRSRRLDCWIARNIMGLTDVQLGADRWVYRHEACGLQPLPRYTHDIREAMDVVAKLQRDFGFHFQLHKKLDEKWSAIFWKYAIFAGGDARDQSLAICRAARHAILADRAEKQRR
jgi:hypothetical protein